MGPKELRDRPKYTLGRTTDAERQARSLSVTRNKPLRLLTSNRNGERLTFERSDDDDDDDCFTRSSPLITSALMMDRSDILQSRQSLKGP